MNKYTLTVIIIIILVVIGIIAINSSSQSPSPTPTPAVTDTGAPVSVVQSPAATAVHTVTYTDGGFSPASVTIANGESVTWVNNSTGRMWVASNPHPTHTDLPGFDEKAFVDPGGSWTYTFMVTGTHGYHNHANPSQMGIIVVN